MGRLNRIETGHPFSMAGSIAQGGPTASHLWPACREQDAEASWRNGRWLAGPDHWRAVVVRRVDGWDAALPQGPGELWGQQRRERRFSETVRHSRLTSVRGANFPETGQRGTTVPSHYIWSGVSLVTCGGPSSAETSFQRLVSLNLAHQRHSLGDVSFNLARQGHSLGDRTAKLRGSLLSMDDRTRPAYRAWALSRTICARRHVTTDPVERRRIRSSRSSSRLGSLCRDLCRDQVFGAGELLSEKNAGLRRQPTDRSDVIVHAIEDPV